MPKIRQIFNFLYSKKTLNHDLPTYDLPKRCFNDASVVFTMCNNQQLNNRRRAKVCEQSEHRATLRSFGKSWLFLLNCWIGMFLANNESANCRWQITCWQIITFLFSANRYAPIIKGVVLNVPKSYVHNKWPNLFELKECMKGQVSKMHLIWC